ncbi:NAD(+) kinase [Vibrio alginolyticus]|uniref:NAD(+) kinase n=1 Tax=Vibrio sp. B1FLJ16 TaxID=2751178 RepID=UPI0015F75188|nr:NAD(+) kinase [Vibrio sp. B1FLJ16]MCA0935783.1 NAD(+) kinase [Vibrio alginolyticus]CAD7800441.1 Involved in the regulation of the intracellular balance of NAD and NADP [Vibrio sp. B1FLJ16]CAD7800468.1 Involved in the regulation of the intracellular balance of NAD and NADP [Vibrio sp. B1FLJ16]CAE6887726.1 Involved in the regulation of the intracellular balance of NAD and NADP [Vibrio sp. B1FLJ16]CAE6888663.1 Involved in the regulation of the intracellular balance of NAD and NADP [Vibrio sp. 
MKNPCNVIAIIGKPRDQQAIQTHRELYQWLTSEGYKVFIDDRLAAILDEIPQKQFASLVELGKNSDLAIVVGGDGNMLGAARILSRFDVPVIGVNRGNLGFLTDLNPDDFQAALKAVLDGEYIEEERFLLETEVHRHGQIKSHNAALNEAVLHPGQIAHMIEFEVYIDESFAFSLRADGLIVSTPTGSTAYSLSGGGPILSPSLNAISLVPMFPHTLSSRPLVVDGKRRIKLLVSPENRGTQEVSCDGQVSLPVSPGDEIHIYQSPNVLKLVHPKDYSYYHVLRNKLGWSSRLF